MSKGRDRCVNGLHRPTPRTVLFADSDPQILRALDHLTQLDPELMPTETAVNELVEALQYKLGHSTLRSWNFSEDTCEAARAMDPDAGPPEKVIVEIVQAAVLHRQKARHAPSPRPRPQLIMDQDAIESLEISDVEMAALMVDLEDEIDDIAVASALPGFAKPIDLEMRL